MRTRGYFTKRSQATADLKRHAHDVRQRIDAMPEKQRQRLMSSRVSKRAEDGTPIAVAFSPPSLSPRDRHRWAWGW